MAPWSAVKVRLLLVYAFLSCRLCYTCYSQYLQVLLLWQPAWGAKPIKYLLGLKNRRHRAGICRHIERHVCQNAIDNLFRLFRPQCAWNQYSGDCPTVMDAY